MNPKMRKWAADAAEKGKPWPRGKLGKAKRLAERMKGQGAKAGGVENPHALARWATARGIGGKGKKCAGKGAKE